MSPLGRPQRTGVHRGGVLAGVRGAGAVPAPRRGAVRAAARARAGPQPAVHGVRAGAQMLRLSAVVVTFGPAPVHTCTRSHLCFVPASAIASAAAAHEPPTPAVEVCSLQPFAPDSPVGVSRRRRTPATRTTSAACGCLRRACLKRAIGTAPPQCTTRSCRCAFLWTVQPVSHCLLHAEDSSLIRPSHRTFLLEVRRSPVQESHTASSLQWTGHECCHSIRRQG